MFRGKLLHKVIGKFFVLSLCLVIMVGQIAAQTVPSPSTDNTQRFGLYHWIKSPLGGLKPGDIDIVNWGANKVADSGTKVVRVP